MPKRIKQLENWLREHCSMDNFTLEPASEDASFRRYFRVSKANGETCVVMDAPPEKEDCRPFLAVAGQLASAGVHVPAIVASNLEAGFILLEDLGSRQYLAHLDDASVDRLYGDALASLMTMQATVATEALPAYDRNLLLAEMQLFPEWLLTAHLGLSLSIEEQEMLDKTMVLLADAALAQPQVFVHRDYHSRNLMLTKVNNPGIIDFQDAVTGPLTYDLVSLLRDCYIRWPAQQVDNWVSGYHELCVQSGVLPENVSEIEFLRWFDLMGVQRHLKAAGIFARLLHRDGKPGYMGDVPRTLEYIVEVAQRRTELQPLAALISDKVLPALNARN